jgi:uncharacterized membrane protein required for colicin V production
MVNLLAADMPLIVDVVGILFILIFAIRGMREGFGQMFITTFGTIICLAASILLCSAVANLSESWFGLISKVAEKLEPSLINTFGNDVMSKTLGELLVDGVLGAEQLEALNINGFLREIILSVSNNGNIVGTETLGDLISSAFAYYIVLIISAVILFIAFKILLRAISALTDKLRSFVLVAAVDEVLGFVAGLISGVIYLELVILLISTLGGVIAPVQSIYTVITNSTVISYIHEIGLLQEISNFVTSSGIIKLFSK